MRYRHTHGVQILEAKIVDKHYTLRPYVLSLRATERCNVGCSHCSLSAKPSGEDMPIEMATRAIHEAAESGIGLLHISGGEPLLYHHLPALVAEGKAVGMTVEMVTSTYTMPKHDQAELEMIENLADSGLDRVMISYDDGHAQRVSIDKIIGFTEAAMEAELDICIFGVNSPHGTIDTHQIAEAFAGRGIDPGKLDWAGALFSYAGRGADSLAQLDPNARPSYARCPYVMPVPTLIPNGQVLLCPCSILQSDRFVIGDYLSDGLAPILDAFERSSVYRFLGKFGPHASLLKCGWEEPEIPVEICIACERYLQFMSKQNDRQLAEFFHEYDLEEIYVDFDALLSPHQRYLLENFR